MPSPFEKVDALLGVTTPEHVLRDLFELHGVTPSADADWEASASVIYEVAADAADRQAQALIGASGVTAVEDIAVDARRPLQAWWDLADRLRARAAELADDDGPFVVPYCSSSRAEATEWTRY